MNEEADNEVLISIIIATYNAVQHLHSCLESIVKHAGKNTEVVIIDGGSTDGTIQLLQAFSYAPLIWKSQPDRGIYDALNKGVAFAKGKWLHFLGADDKLLPGFTKLAEKLSDPNTIYYGDSVPFYDGENQATYGLLHGVFDNYRIAKYSINHQAIFYPANAFKKHSYNLKYKVHADSALNIQLWGDETFNKIYFPINIVAYNMTGFSSATKDELFIQDKPQIIKESMGFFMYTKYMLKRMKNKRKGKTDML